MASVLERLGEFAGSDKLEHGYLPHYAAHLRDLYSGKDRQCTLVEVGIATGASLRLWKNYFGLGSTIIGIDNAASTMLDEEGIKTILGDATTKQTLDLIPLPDIFIDDGSHMAEDVLATLRIQWPRMKSGSWYVIEDLGCIYTTGFGGDPDGGGVVAKELHNYLEEALRGGEVSEFHAYLEIVFMRKA